MYAKFCTPTQLANRMEAEEKVKEISRKRDEVPTPKEPAEIETVESQETPQMSQETKSWEFPKKVLKITIDVKSIIDQSPEDDYASELKAFVEDLSSGSEKELMVVETVLDLIKDLKEPPSNVEIPFEDIMEFGEELTKTLIGGIILGLLTHYRQAL